MYPVITTTQVVIRYMKAIVKINKMSEEPNLMQISLVDARKSVEEGDKIHYKKLSDSYPAFFLLIATTSNKKFLKVQKL